MKTILHNNDINTIIFRINSLSDNATALWYRMNVNQMICHCSDQIAMVEGKIEFQYVGNSFLSTALKSLILLGMPAPKRESKNV